MSDGSMMAAARARLTATVWGGRPRLDPETPHLIGLLEGEGVGREIIPVAMALLDILRSHTERRIEVRRGGLIGHAAKAAHGESLTADVINFGAAVFEARGALFCGPGGDRFVYDLRRRFDLFCKFTPLEPLPELRGAGVLRPEVLDDVDIIAVRENSGGLYQGAWDTTTGADGRVTATHRFAYDDGMIRRILAVALALASSRRKRLHLVLKPGGAPSISSLWRACAQEMTAGGDVALIEHEIDNAVYQLVANPRQYDVILSPNMFGDVLADGGSVLLASRGLSYSGNFNDRGDAVYQTGHGAAWDIAGQDVANPIGQILSLGMLLRESFDWPEADSVLRRTIGDVLRDGFCTRDIAMPGAEVLGTRAFGTRLEAALRARLADAVI
jgi:3-isopropylmalate dehydrogenase